MLWLWWSGMAAVGLALGCLGAWSVGAARVFMKTLAVPLTLAASRLLFPRWYPLKNSPFYVLIDYLLIACFGLISDYCLGLYLGRHDRAGFRSDSVGH